MLHTKQNPRTPGGPYRKGCPAAGPNPTVSCPRHEERHGITASVGRTVIKKISDREFERSNAALPRVQPPPLPASAWPAVCRSDSITFQPGDNAKLRQPYAHGSSRWREQVQAVRGQNEGGNGTSKGIDIDLGDPKRRRPRGTVALTIQLAIQITTANLAQADRAAVREQLPSRRGTGRLCTRTGAQWPVASRPNHVDWFTDSADYPGRSDNLKQDQPGQRHPGSGRIGMPASRPSAGPRTSETPRVRHPPPLTTSIKPRNEKSRRLPRSSSDSAGSHEPCRGVLTNTPLCGA